MFFIRHVNILTFLYCCGKDDFLYSMAMALLWRLACLYRSGLFLFIPVFIMTWSGHKFCSLILCWKCWSCTFPNELRCWLLIFKQSLNFDWHYSKHMNMSVLQNLGLLFLSLEFCIFVMWSYTYLITFIPKEKLHYLC